MDPLQIIISIVIVAVAVTLIVVSYQVFLLVKDMRKTFHKTNRILDEVQDMTESIKRPVDQLSHLTSGIQTGISLIEKFIPKKD